MNINFFLCEEKQFSCGVYSSRFTAKSTESSRTPPLIANPNSIQARVSQRKNDGDVRDQTECNVETPMCGTMDLTAWLWGEMWEWIECDHHFPSEPLVVLIVDQFFGRGSGPLERKKQDSQVYRKTGTLPLSFRKNQSSHNMNDEVWKTFKRVWNSWRVMDAKVNTLSDYIFESVGLWQTLKHRSLPSIEILMTRKAKEVFLITLNYFKTIHQFY